MEHVNRKSLLRQQVRRFGHGRMSTAGPVQADHGRKPLSISAGQEAVEPDVLATALEDDF
jgi:hypothetical protein